MTTDTVEQKKSKTTNKIQEPGRYKVIICNDDVTPVDFVVNILITIFKHDPKTAQELTLSVHNTGSAVAGVYRYEIAEQKCIDSNNTSRSNGFPLITKVEPE